MGQSLSHHLGRLHSPGILVGKAAQASRVEEAWEGHRESQMREREAGVDTWEEETAVQLEALEDS